MNRHSVRMLAMTTVVLAAAVTGSGTAQALQIKPTDHRQFVTLTANLTELNNSGASGTVTTVIRAERIKKIRVSATGLTPNAPHAQHIHYGNQALNECPTAAFDLNGDGRVNTVEGLPAYGPVVISLTDKGDTTPASLLAVDRYPVSQNGSYEYRRNNIRFTAVDDTGYDGPNGRGTAAEIAASIRDGEGVVVIHGVDYNGNGVYDFSAGASELDPSLPAEATDPAACGVLR